MTLDPPTAYEQLTPTEAAHVDAVCDRFERGWKATRAGGPVPRVAAFLDGGHGAVHAALLRELIALDLACRKRFGHPVRPDDLPFLAHRIFDGASWTVEDALSAACIPRSSSRLCCATCANRTPIS